MPLTTVDKSLDGREILKFTPDPRWPKFLQTPVKYLIVQGRNKLSEHDFLSDARKVIGKELKKPKDKSRAKKKSTA